MAAYLNVEVYDSGLDWVETKATRLDICSQQPTDYTGATSTYSLGNKTSISVAAPSDRAGGGREVIIAAITDGEVTATGTASHWALTDGTSILVAAGPLSASQAVTDGNTFTLTSFAIGIPAPA